MHFTLLLPVLTILTTTQALPYDVRSPFAIKERHPVPYGWERVGAANKDDIIEVQNGLKQRFESAVERHLDEISDPQHARYGQHLSASEIRQLVAPAGDTQRLVRAWLRDHGIPDDKHHFSAAQDWMTATVTIKQAETMIDTSYSKFIHKDGAVLLRAPEWSLPSQLHDHVDVV